MIAFYLTKLKVIFYMLKKYKNKIVKNKVVEKRKEQ